MDSAGRQVQQKIDVARALLAAIERLLTLRTGAGVVPARAKSTPKKKAGSADADAEEDDPASENGGPKRSGTFRYSGLCPIQGIEYEAKALLASTKDLQTRLAAEEIRYSLSMGYLLLKTAEEEKHTSREELSRTLVTGGFANMIDKIVRDAEKVVDAVGLKHAPPSAERKGAPPRKQSTAPTHCSEIQTLLNSYPRAGDATRAAPERPKLDYKQCADCGIEMVADTETSEMKCPGCGSLHILESMAFEETQTYNQEGQKSKSGRFNPNRHFFLWWTHVYACEPEEELGDPDDPENIYGEKLLTKMREIVRREKKILRFIDVEDVRSMLRECKKTSLYRNTALIMKKLTGVGPPMPTDSLAQKVEKYFTKAIEISEEIRPPNRSNRNYYPFYIYKLLDALLPPDDHEQRRVLYYIYLQSEETLTRDDREWHDICDDPGMRDIKYVPTKRGAAARYRPT